MQNLKFSVEDVNILKEVSDEQLAIAEVYVCHDGDNAHGMPISLETIKEATPTLLNKFLVADYNGFDFLDHTQTQMILGFFPAENDIKYVEKNGKTYLVANAIISKTYVPWAYELFVENNYKSVSMEIVVLDLEEENGVKHIKRFAFNGVTVLGDRVNPACEGSNVQIFKFSQDDFVKQCNKVYHKFTVGDKLGKEKSITIDNSKESAIMSETWSGQGAGFLNKILKASNHESLVDEAYLIVDTNGDLSVNDVHYPHHSIRNGKLVVNRKGVISAFQRAKQQGLTGEPIEHLKRHYKELGLSTENFGEEARDLEDEKDFKEDINMSDNANVDPNAMADTLIDEAKQNEKKSDEYEKETNMSEDSSEVSGIGMADPEEKKEEDDDSKEDEEESDEEEKEDFAMMYAKLKDEHTIMMAELEELRKFKMEYDEMQQKMAVEETMAYVSDVMPEEMAEEYREKGMGCKYSELTAWSNEVKAKALEFSKPQKKESFIRIGLNYTDIKTKNVPNDSIWNKL